MDCIALARARINRGMNKAEVSKKAGYRGDAYYKKERGFTSVTIKDAVAISNALNLNFREFVDIFFDGKLPISNFDGDIIGEVKEIING